MKKVIKITLYILAIICVITLGICFLVIPNDTTLFCKTIWDFLNTPIVVGCGCSATIGLVIWEIFKNTSFGKVALVKLESKYITLKKDYDKFAKDTTTQYHNLSQDVETKKKEMEKVGQEQLAILSNYSKRIDNLCESIEKVCETSPNAKIKALGKEIHDLNDQAKELSKKEIAKIDEKYASLVDTQVKPTLEQLEQKFKELKGMIEQYGETKEAIND